MAARIMTTDGADRPFPIPPLAARLFTILGASGIEARIVGGAVRDWLVGRVIGDIDMAVAAPIDRVAALLRDAGLKVIDTGLDHGTVTVVDDGRHLEITQTRVDLETDGRHAVVAFSDDWAVDAARRDFTINALYVDGSGRVEDPLGGRADLEAGILRFVGTATRRVEEDALRMLRYCRFLPHFGAAGTDDDALAAIAGKAGLAANLSGERVANELSRLLTAPGAAAAITLMQQTGLAAAALGGTLDSGRLTPVIDQAVATVFGDDHPAWLVRLAVIMQPGMAGRLATRLRLSRHGGQFLQALDGDLADADAVDHVAALTGAAWRQAAWRWQRSATKSGTKLPSANLPSANFPSAKLPAAGLVVASARAGHPVDSAHLVRLAAWVPPAFPLTGADLLSQGVDSGPALGELLRAAEEEWVARDFAPTRDDLLAFIGLDPAM